MSSKASPRPLFNFVKYPKAATACQKQDISKDDHHKAFKKLALYYLLNPIPFMDQIMKNQRGLVTSRSSGYKVSSEKFL